MGKRRNEGNRKTVTAQSKCWSHPTTDYRENFSDNHL